MGLRCLTAVLLAAMSLAGCQTVGVTPSPSAPGTTTTIRAPDNNRWTSRRDQTGALVYVCRPLACASPTGVRVQTSRSPSRVIDKAALERYAKEVVPASVRAAGLQVDASSGGYRKIRMVSSRTSSMRGFPTVIVETHHTGDGPPKAGFRAYVFAGNTLIDTFAISNDRVIAQQTLTDFVNGYEIDDRPPE